ncbi:MAG TPA: porin [Burkholderiales bacterium]|nr:porin [Burkholderiales bacterium]
MQKKLLTAAVASVLAAPCIALAQTAASVEVYGTVYPTFGHVKYGDGFAARDTNVATGAAVASATIPSMSKFDVQAPSSNFGVRGRESLGAGLTAWFQIEQNAPLEREATQSVTVASRNSAAGVQGGWGNVFVGQWTTPWADLDSLWAIGQVSVFGPVTTLIGRRESTGVSPNPASARNQACATTIIAPGGTGAPSANTTPQCDAVVGAGGVGHAFWRRASDMIRYTSPSFSGLTFDAMYQVPELKTVGISSGVNYTAEPSMMSTSLKWSGMGGRARVGAAIDRHKDFTSIGKTDSGYAIKGGFNFGVVDIGAAYENLTYKCGSFNSTPAQVAAAPVGVTLASATAGADLPTLCRTEGDVKNKTWSLAASVPVGIGAIKAFYAKTSDMTGAIGVGDTGAKMFGLGYDHRFSKRTSLGVEYTKIDNSRNAQFTWTGMPPTQTGASNTPSFGVDVTWVFVGMVHRF